MSTFLLGKTATVTINGTAMAVEDGSYDTSVDVDETTNLIDGGFYSDVGTVKKATGNLKCIYDGDSPPDFDEGDIIEMTIAVPTGPGISGDFRVTKMSYPYVTPKAAVKYNFDFTSNGPYVKTGGAV